jgi:hypothetical protein
MPEVHSDAAVHTVPSGRLDPGSIIGDGDGGDEYRYGGGGGGDENEYRYGGGNDMARELPAGHGVTTLGRGGVNSSGRHAQTYK